MLMQDSFEQEQPVTDTTSTDALCIARLRALPQSEQRSPQWFQDRLKRITASEAATVITRSKECLREYNKHTGKALRPSKSCCNPYENREDYIFQKSFQAHYGLSQWSNAATSWGQKYESIAAELYKKVTGTREIYEFGLLGHASLDWLGASPDGVTNTGIAIEIKCPKSREITGVPTLYYWIQVQIQLEVLDLEAADFIEVQIEEHETPDEEWAGREFKGVYHGDAFMVSIVPGISQCEDFCRERVSDVPFTYFSAVVFSVTRINRSREWFAACKDELESTILLIRGLQADKALFDKTYQGCLEESTDIVCLL
jgi:putative phage-type endonuclease